jgi:hypothetical protein
MLQALAADGATPDLIAGTAPARSTLHGSRPQVLMGLIDL